MPESKVRVAISYAAQTDLDIELPRYMTEGSAGLDLRAAVKQDLTLEHGDTALIPTGIKVAVPSEYEAQIRPRSGLAAKHGISVLNSPGTIDCDYRGEIKVILINLGHEDFIIRRNDRIAQMVIAPVVRVELNLVDDLDKTDRNEGGFGHTGV